MPYPQHRRIFGIFLGAMISLALALVTQYINQLIMPGVPFYQPPFGAAGNALMILLIGILLAAVTSWPSESIHGVFLGALTGALVTAASVLLPALREPGQVLNRITGLVLIFLPTAALLAVGLFVFRWLVDREETAYREKIHWKPPARLPRVVLPALLVVSAGLLGLLAMYNDLGRSVTPRMLALLQDAQQAPTRDDLPEALRAKDTRFVFENIRQPFTLQWDKDDRNQFAIGRPGTRPYDQSTVIARFENGYLLACMYPSPTHEPRCKDFLPQTQP